MRIERTIWTEGYACPNPDCQYFGVTEAQRHALVGFGKLGENKDVQRLKCQVCGERSAAGKGRRCTISKEVEEVCWWQAIDPKSKALLALHLGLSRSEVAYTLFTS